MDFCVPCASNAFGDWKRTLDPLEQTVVSHYVVLRNHPVYPGKASSALYFWAISADYHIAFNLLFSLFLQKKQKSLFCIFLSDIDFTKEHFILTLFELKYIDAFFILFQFGAIYKYIYKYKFMSKYLGASQIFFYCRFFKFHCGQKGNFVDFALLKL